MTPNDVIHRALRHQFLEIPGIGKYEIKSACLFFDGETVGIEVWLVNDDKVYISANEELYGIYIAA